MAKGDTVLDLDEAFFVLQKKNQTTQEWITQGKHTYRGRPDAQTVLKRIRESPEHAGEEWRSLLKQEAERYREGWNDCAEYIERVFKIRIDDKDPDVEDVVSAARSARNVPGRRVSPPSARKR